MKKIYNRQETIIDEMLEGIINTYGDFYKRTNNGYGIITKNNKDKVGIVIGGGSGHEPLFFGFVGEGLADGAAIGNVFAAPNPDTILEVTKAVNSGKGVLYIYGNYSGDVLNFDMAAELAEMEDIQTKTVTVTDDVASSPHESRHERRGIAGNVFVFKIAGAAADDGLSLEEVARVAEKTNQNTASIGVALTPGSIPGVDKPTFTIGDDEIEFGMGIHGEPGVKRSKMMSADRLTDEMLELLFNDLSLHENDEICLLVNGLGSTTLLELFIVSRRVTKILNNYGIKIIDSDVNRYCTTQEMGGLSITLTKLDHELKKYYLAPAYSPYYFKKLSELKTPAMELKL